MLILRESRISFLLKIKSFWQKLQQAMPWTELERILKPIEPELVILKELFSMVLTSRKSAASILKLIFSQKMVLQADQKDIKTFLKTKNTKLNLSNFSENLKDLIINKELLMAISKKSYKDS